MNKESFAELYALLAPHRTAEPVKAQKRVVALSKEPINNTPPRLKDKMQRVRIPTTPRGCVNRIYDQWTSANYNKDTPKAKEFQPYFLPQKASKVLFDTPIILPIPIVKES